MPGATLFATSPLSLLHRTNRAVLARAFRRAFWSGRGRPISLERNLDAAYRWICAAQDATDDGGVAGCYNLITGWGASYPETTGYIIPTFLHYSIARDEPDAWTRALRMADWEAEIQLPYGAVRSGMLDVKVGPAVFNTGQVIFGWIAAHQATDDEHYRRAAANACEWLVRVQSEDGAWRRHLSMLTTSSVQTYNIRTAWGLAYAGAEWNEPRWVTAARKNCEWVLKRQHKNGWFESNAFADDEVPLLHTIAYALEGLLGAGELFGAARYMDAVIAGVKPLVEAYEQNQVLYGRYDHDWKPTVSWRCLTGEAQLAVVLLRLGRLTSERRYRVVANSLIEGVAALQDMESRHYESFGSVSGSEPIWGGYGPLNYFNWAAKFFMDAVLLAAENVDVQRSLREHQQNLALPA